MIIAGLALLGAHTPLHSTASVEVPSGLDHKPWKQLLKTYVNDKGLVDYKRWKESSEDRKALKDYIDQFASEPELAAKGKEKLAALINAYNAFTVEWVLEHYPIASIREIKGTWSGRHWDIGGNLVSLDDIEHKYLRPIMGWKVHGVLVCAARSCPPLQQFAYTDEKLDSQVSEAFQAWLARPDLNTFDPNIKLAEVSKIFKWYREEFNEYPGGVKAVIAHFAPEKYRSFLASAEYTLTFKNYNWGLNDQSDLGKNYKLSPLKLLFSMFKE